MLILVLGRVDHLLVLPYSLLKHILKRDHRAMINLLISLLLQLGYNSVAYARLPLLESFEDVILWQNGGRFGHHYLLPIPLVILIPLEVLVEASEYGLCNDELPNTVSWLDWFDGTFIYRVSC